MRSVGLIFGGANSEHEVSCNSARGVLANLDAAKYRPVLIGIDRDGGWHRLPSVDALGTAGAGARLPDLDGVDLAFPVLHGRFGEDGTVQGLLELAGVPYVGCGVLSSAIAMDKVMASALLASVGVPTIDAVAITAANRHAAADLVSRLGFPLFVKPNRGGSSIGVTRVQSEAELDAAIGLALEHDRIALVQPVMQGDEVDIGILQLADGELLAGAPLRIRTSAEFFDYSAKYTAGGAEFEVPAKLAPGVAAELVDLAKRAFVALDCDGLARVDFFVQPEGTVALNEVNTLPGLTALSQYPRMFAGIGMPYSAVLDALLDRASGIRDFSGR